MSWAKKREREEGRERDNETYTGAACLPDDHPSNLLDNRYLYSLYSISMPVHVLACALVYPANLLF